MKMQIAVENGKQVAGVDRCAVLALEFSELVEVAFGDWERKNAQGHHLKLLAHRIDLPHLLRREIAHDGAAVRYPLDDSLVLQFEQSETHIAAMGVEALAEVLLDQVLARMASAEDNVLFQAPRNDVGDRWLADGDRRPVTRCARCPGANVTGRSFSFGRPNGHGGALSCRTYVYNIKNYIVNNLGRP